MARGAKGVCQRCDFVYLLRQLRKEWTGLKVCSDCWDRKPEALRPPPVKPEGLVKPGASPELAPVFIVPGPIDPSSL